MEHLTVQSGTIEAEVNWNDRTLACSKAHHVLFKGDGELLAAVHGGGIEHERRRTGPCVDHGHAGRYLSEPSQGRRPRMRRVNVLRHMVALPVPRRGHDVNASTSGDLHRQFQRPRPMRAVGEGQGDVMVSRGRFGSSDSSEGHR